MPDNSDGSDYLDRIVQFICDHQFEDLPPEGVERAKMVLADSLAVISALMGGGDLESAARRLISSWA